MKNLKFGAVYVIERDYTEDIIRRDLRNMKDSGYDLITLWPVANPWLSSNSHEFRYDTTRLILDVCQEYGIEAIVQLFGQNQAQEFMPDAALTKDMEAVDEANSNCFWANLNHPVVREYIERYFKYTITELKDHPAVHSWDVFNEAHFISDDPWTTRKYQEWLEKKYKTIEYLNWEWYRRYESFSQIRPDKRNAPYSIWSSLLPDIEYNQFRSENLNEILHFLYDTAKKYDDSHPIIIDGTSSHILYDTVILRNNDEFASAHIPDIYGGTYYPKSWGRNQKDTPWTQSMYFSIPASAARKAHKKYAMNELQTHTQAAMTPGSEVEPEELRNWVWMNIFQAPVIMQLWRWRPFLHGYQVTGRGLTSFDGTPNARSAEVKKIVSCLDANKDFFNTQKVVESPVKIAFSYRHRLCIDSLFKWNKNFWPSDVEGWYRLFWHHGLNPDFIDMDNLDEDDLKAKVIVLPGMMQISSKEAEFFSKYVQNGGILIADCRLGTVDEHANAPLEGIPGKTLGKVFGFVEHDVTSDGHGNMIQELELFDGAKCISEKYGITEHRFGNGITYYANTTIGVKLKTEHIPVLDELVSSLNLDTASKGEKVHVSFTENEEAVAALVINFREEESSVLFKNNTRTALNLMTGEKVDLSKEIILPPFSCFVYLWNK